MQLRQPSRGPAFLRAYRSLSGGSMPRRTLLQKDPRDDLIQVPIEARLQFAVLPSSIADPRDQAVDDYLNPVLLGVKPVSRITRNSLIQPVSVSSNRCLWYVAVQHGHSVSD